VASPSGANFTTAKLAASTIVILEFRSTRVRVQYAAARKDSLWGEQVGRVSYTLVGHACMTAQATDWELPPSFEEQQVVRRTALDTTVSFSPITEWEARLDRSCDLRGIKDTEARAERLSVVANAKDNHAAVFWYIEPSDPTERRERYFNEHACLEVHVRVADSKLRALRSWLARAAERRDLRPRVSRFGVHFSRHPHRVRDGGWPTWDAFMECRMPALADSYVIEFGRSRRQRID
jgi:hypothetical protein